MKTAIIDQSQQGQRIDTLVVSLWKVPSRSFLQNHWNELISINDLETKPSYHVRIGDILKMDEEKIEGIQKANSYSKVISQEGNIDIVLETKDFLVINKPKGIAVHPGVKNTKNTLANYVVGYLESNGQYDERMDRGGIVHRLDKPVSGLILFAKNIEAQKYFQKQFEAHTVNKVYFANVKILEKISKEFLPFIPKVPLNPKIEIDNLVLKDFEIDDSWMKVEGYIGRSNVNRMKMIFRKYPAGNAKSSLTYIKPLSDHELLIIIKTGRMYQIRATLEYLGINIMGDTLFESIKGGRIPEGIELESILLSCLNMEKERFIVRLK